MTYRPTVFLLCALALTAGTAPAVADSLFGAIAFSSATGKIGFGKNFAAKKEASTEAVSQCGAGDCATVVVFPACGAVAVGDGYGYGFSADKSIAKSEETALSNCNGYTANCLITMSVCNDGN